MKLGDQVGLLGRDWLLTVTKLTEKRFVARHEEGWTITFRKLDGRSVGGKYTHIAELKELLL